MRSSLEEYLASISSSVIFSRVGRGGLCHILVSEGACGTGKFSIGSCCSGMVLFLSKLSCNGQFLQRRIQRLRRLAFLQCGLHLHVNLEVIGLDRKSVV